MCRSIGDVTDAQQSITIHVQTMACQQNTELSAHWNVWKHTHHDT